jgi:hypothetical protein
MIDPDLRYHEARVPVADKALAETYDTRVRFHDWRGSGSFREGGTAHETARRRQVTPERR